MANEQFQNTFTPLEAKSIDFVYRFGESLRDLQNILGITNLQPVMEGYTVKTKIAPSAVTLADGNVAEGELIPLSKVEFKDGGSFELTTQKWRKRTSYEAIQRFGQDVAIDLTDNEILKEVQRNIHNDLLAFTNENAVVGDVASTNGLQGAVASAWGNLERLFEGQADRFIVFANPMDIATYLGNSNIQMQTVFGLTYLEGFLNTTIIASNNVTPGQIIATVPKNLNMYYIPANSEGGSAFGLHSDNTGLVGMKHSLVDDRVSYDTIFVTGVKLVPEIENGIVKIDITDGTTDDVPEV